jgi:DNA-binding PadR family transcriptional regulator
MHENSRRGYLRACLLLLIAEHPDHGYDLTARLPALGLADADATTTYRMLRMLESDGAVVSAWRPSGSGPARRVYHLTGRGLADLAECGRELRSTQAQMAGLLRRYEAVPGLLRRRRADAVDRPEMPATLHRNGGRT